MDRRPASLLAVLASLALLAPGLWPAPGHAAEPLPRAGRAEPSAPAVIVAATGQEVGPVIGMVGPAPVVVVRADGRDAVVAVFADRLLSVEAVALYDSADCTGPPWLLSVLPVGFATPLAEPAAVGRLNELLVANGDPETRTLKSYWDQLETPPGCATTSRTEIVRPTRVLLDLGLLPPPYRRR